MFSPGYLAAPNQHYCGLWCIEMQVNYGFSHGEEELDTSIIIKQPEIKNASSPMFKTINCLALVIKLASIFLLRGR